MPDMSTVLLIRPWRYHDQAMREHDLSQQWRNAPYSLVLLATLLRRQGHRVQIADLERDLVMSKGDLGACIAGLRHQLTSMCPDIVGVGFFSVHYLGSSIAPLPRRGSGRGGGASLDLYMIMGRI